MTKRLWWIGVDGDHRSWQRVWSVGLTIEEQGVLRGRVHGHGLTLREARDILDQLLDELVNAEPAPDVVDLGGACASE